jgi:hypothetical protein
MYSINLVQQHDSGMADRRLPARAGNLFSAGPTSELRLSQPSIQWVDGELSLTEKRPGCETESPPLLQRLRMPAAVPPFPIHLHCLVRR